MATKPLILLFFIFVLGQSVDDQKWQSEFDQNSMEKSVNGNDDEDREQSREGIGDYDPSLDVQNSDGSECNSDGVETDESERDQDGHISYQDGQDNMSMDSKDHDELHVELNELVKELAKNDQLSAKRKKVAIELKVARMLGTYRSKMYEWRREANLLDRKVKRPSNESDEGIRYNLAKKFERMTDEAYSAMKNLAKQQGKKICKKYTNQERFAIVNRFMEIKEEYMAQTGPTTAMTCQELDREIAREFQLNKDTIYQWKSKLGILERPQRMKSKAEKEKIMQEYIKLKKEDPKITDAELAKGFGISLSALRNMKKTRKGRLGLPEIKTYTDDEKRSLMRQFYKIRAQNPELSIRAIERRLKLAHNSIWFWEKKFANIQNNEVGTETKSVVEDLSVYKGSLTDNGEEMWRWNSATMRRRVN